MPSEDEYYTDSEMGSDDDILTMSTNSEDLNNEDAENEDWSKPSADRIVEMQDRKHASTERREAILKAYLYLTRHHFAGREVERHFDDITQALMKSVRSGTSEIERSMALQALAVTILSTHSENCIRGGLFRPEACVSGGRGGRARKPKPSTPSPSPSPTAVARNCRRGGARFPS